VRYDSLEGGLRHLDVDEIDDLFGPGDWPTDVWVDARARRIGRPFRESFDRATPTWLLTPEVAWHEPEGTEKLARAISQCRAWGVRTAHILYDLIPIHNPVYQGAAAAHAAYLAELVRTDLILPISIYSGDQLAAYWAAQGLSSLPPISPVLLPDGGFSKARPPAPSAASTRTGPIVMIGTVEPRKRQMQVLKAFAALRTRSAEAARRKVLVIGSMDPILADDFNAFIARNDWVDYRNYVCDAELSAAYATAAFTVFASEDEGYGLPISESLTAGAPCLCANFGAMAEIAQGGGCFTVNVRDDAALEAALATLCEQPAELMRLDREIAARKFKTWGDYADILLHRMFERAGAVEADPSQTAPNEGLSLAPVITFESAADRVRFIETTDRTAQPGLLPSRLALSEDEAVCMAATLAAETSRRHRIAATEAAYRQACIATARQHPLRPIFLRVLISTYNRCDFVTANVKWLLASVLPTTDAAVDLIVVDGGSTDGTVEALREIVDYRFTLVESSVNVGRLGGWREAAKRRDAVYVWGIGDDDFIRPEEFGAIIKALQTHIGVPLAAVNFGVYRRAAWRAGDRVEQFLAEAQPVAATPAQSGLIPTARAAEQHDNLFTSISSVIWRADLLSAAYDHAFDGPPFSNMIQASPSTEAILREYGACDILWWGPPALAVAAHNRRSRDRPLWHGVVMPQAFALARDVGVDPVRLQQWADERLDLFREALAIAKTREIPNSLTPEMLELAHIHFREDVSRELDP